MNPTVSESSTRRLDGNRTARIVGSSVANIFGRDQHGPHAAQRALNSVGFSGVRVTHQSHGAPSGIALARLAAPQ